MEAVFIAATPISSQANTAMQFLLHPTWIQLAEMLLSCFVKHAASKSLWLFLVKGFSASWVLQGEQHTHCILSISFLIFLIPVSHMDVSQRPQDPTFVPSLVELHSILSPSQSIKEVNTCSN